MLSQVKILQILNLGCGDQTYGTHRVDIKQTQATTHVFDIEHGLLFPDGMFDEIYERNLLEHLRNVGFHLDECYRVLKEGGIVVLITDNAECRRYYSLGTHTGRYKGHRKYFSDDGDRHYAIFTKEHLKNLFEKSGFHIKEISFIDTDYVPTRAFDKIARALGLKAYPRIKVVASK